MTEGRNYGTEIDKTSGLRDKPFHHMSPHLCNKKNGTKLADVN